MSSISDSAGSNNVCFVNKCSQDKKAYVLLLLRECNWCLSGMLSSPIRTELQPVGNAYRLLSWLTLDARMRAAPDKLGVNFPLAQVGVSLKQDQAGEW